MKAAIYNPYLDTLGGGERYTMAVAQALTKAGYRVDVQWKDQNTKQKLEKRFGLKLKGINFIENINRGDSYDVCFWVSDGSIPLLRARKNLLHFQIPFCKVSGKTLLNKMKLFRINEIICNSLFTKKIIDKEYGVNSKVIYPPVDVENIKPKRKENLILSVGRFSQLTQAKRQGVLIRAFKKLYNRGLEDWKLTLAGGIEIGARDFVKKIKRMSEGYPIEILQSPDYKVIKDLYGKAKIFWSASGYGIDEVKMPQKVEHFGIAVVEAMAAGAVPVVYSAGGHKEIIVNNQNGFLWDNTRQLLSKTKKLMSDNDLLRKISTEGKRKSQIYSYERFEKEIWEIL